MSNDATNESEKILESLFEPDNAEILLELKDGPKLLSFITKKIAISKEELDENLSYLIEKGFVSKNEKNDDISYLLDTEKLSKVLENDDNFKNIDDGLAKLDSFLNWQYTNQIKLKINKQNYFFFWLIYKYSKNAVGLSTWNFGENFSWQY